MGIIMTRKEAKEFKKIAELVHEVWQVQKDNPKEDVLPYVLKNWSKNSEDHFHVSMDEINIAFQDGGIAVYSDHWKNAEGDQIIGLLGILPNEKKVRLDFGYVKRHKKFEWTTTIAWGNCHGSYFDYATNNYLRKVTDQALHFVIDNFNYAEVAAKLTVIRALIKRKEFGLSVAGDSYFMKSTHESPDYAIATEYYTINDESK